MTKKVAFKRVSSNSTIKKKNTITQKSKYYSVKIRFSAFCWAKQRQSKKINERAIQFTECECMHLEYRKKNHRWIHLLHKVFSPSPSFCFNSVLYTAEMWIRKRKKKTNYTFAKTTLFITIIKTLIIEQKVKNKLQFSCANGARYSIAVVDSSSHRFASK